MLELSAAYLAAAVLIGVMLYLARQNQKQGWQRERNAWGQARSTAAVASLAPRMDPPLEHFSDLARLQQALATEDQSARKEQLVPSR
jgi:hypothetical protein